MRGETPFSDLDGAPVDNLLLALAQRANRGLAFAGQNRAGTVATWTGFERSYLFHRRGQSLQLRSMRSRETLEHFVR